MNIAEIQRLESSSARSENSKDKRTSTSPDQNVVREMSHKLVRVSLWCTAAHMDTTQYITHCNASHITQYITHCNTSHTPQYSTLQHITHTTVHYTLQLITHHTPHYTLHLITHTTVHHTHHSTLHCNTLTHHSTLHTATRHTPHSTLYTAYCHAPHTPSYITPTETIVCGAHDTPEASAQRRDVLVIPCVAIGNGSAVPNPCDLISVTHRHMGEALC